MSQGQRLVFCFDLNKRDMDIFRAIKTNLTIEKRNTFSADDVFLWNLDRFFVDKQHEVGALFAKLQHQGFIEKAGRTRSERASNHEREIRLYGLTEKGKARETKP